MFSGQTPHCKQALFDPFQLCRIYIEIIKRTGHSVLGLSKLGQSARQCRQRVIQAAP